MMFIDTKTKIESPADFTGVDAKRETSSSAC